MSKCIRLTGEVPVPVAQHASIDVVTINLTTSKVQVRGQVGYYVDGPEGGKVLVAQKARDVEVEMTPAVEAFVEAMIGKVAQSKAFKGEVEDVPA